MVSTYMAVEDIITIDTAGVVNFFANLAATGTQIVSNIGSLFSGVLLLFQGAVMAVQGVISIFSMCSGIGIGDLGLDDELLDGLDGVEVFEELEPPPDESGAMAVTTLGAVAAGGVAVGAAEYNQNMARQGDRASADRDTMLSASLSFEPMGRTGGPQMPPGYITPVASRAARAEAGVGFFTPLEPVSPEVEWPFTPTLSFDGQGHVVGPHVPVAVFAEAPHAPTPAMLSPLPGTLPAAPPPRPLPHGWSRAVDVRETHPVVLRSPPTARSEDQFFLL
mmetsp:Transcript_47024/g.110728  ORF Transcript_47024/g.110728 Transcript_47024/m.110728 type:complete len:278 (-) Transcript_47024:174-1007(-)